MKTKRLIPIIIELVGIATIGTGIGLELSVGGDVFLVVITIGSVLVAGGGLLYGKILKGK